MDNHWQDERPESVVLWQANTGNHQQDTIMEAEGSDVYEHHEVLAQGMGVVEEAVLEGKVAEAKEEGAV